MEKTGTSRRHVVAGMLMGSALASRVWANEEEPAQEIVVSNEVILDDVASAKIARRIVEETSLAVEKTLAHAIEPENYPLPSDPHSMEQILWQHFRMLDHSRLTLAGASAVSRLRAGNTVLRRMSTDLVHVNLHSPVSVADQADALPYPEDVASAIRSSRFGKASTLANTLAPIPTDVSTLALRSLRSLSLRLRQVKCLDETGGTDVGSDEIMLGGATIDETGDTSKISPFMVHDDFDDGETETFIPPKSLVTFNLLEGKTFPKYYNVTLVMTERDLGGTAALIEQLYRTIKDRVLNYLRNNGSIVTIVANVVAACINEIWNRIKDWLRDDPLNPRTVSIRIPSATHRFSGRTTSPPYTIQFTGAGGRYNLTYDWRLGT